IHPATELPDPVALAVETAEQGERLLVVDSARALGCGREQRDHVVDAGGEAVLVDVGRALVVRDGVLEEHELARRKRSLACPCEDSDDNGGAAVRRLGHGGVHPAPELRYPVTFAVEAPE